MIAFDIPQGEVRECFVNGDPAKVTQVDGVYIIINSTGQPYPFSDADLQAQIEHGMVSFVDPRPSSFIAPSMTFKQREKVEYWKPYLTALDREDRPGSLEVRKRVIRQVSMRQSPHKRVPSASSLYGYYRRYLAAERNVLAVVTSVQKPSDVRAKPALVELFNEVMDDHYLKPTGALSLRRCYEIMQQRFSTATAEDNHPLAGLKMISQAQFYNWANHLLITPEMKLKKLSNRERTVMRRKAVQQFQLDQILERVEVDAATINIGLLDDEGNYLGAPIVYAMIDCYSRSILGIHVQVGGGEKSSSVLHLYHQMLAPKTEVRQQYGCVNDWPMFGVPTTLVSDSGPGFSSHQVSTFLSQVQIANIKAEVRKPWKKPFIERFFHTCRTQLFSTMNGYVGKRKDQKELDISMRDAACITLREFREILTRYIVDDYHQRPHSGLNRDGYGKVTPYQVWKAQAKFVPPNVPANADQFRYNKGIILTRNLAREGVSANSITYHSSELDSLVIEKGLQYPVPCTVLVDEEDVGSVTVLLNKYGIKVVVPAKKDFETLRGKSLHEYRVLKKAKASKGASEALGQHIPTDATDVHIAASQKKPAKKAKSHSRKANLGAIQQEAELMKDLHEAELLQQTDPDDYAPIARIDDDEDEDYEIV